MQTLFNYFIDSLRDCGYLFNIRSLAVIGYLDIVDHSVQMVVFALVDH